MVNGEKLRTTAATERKSNKTLGKGVNTEPLEQAPRRGRGAPWENSRALMLPGCAGSGLVLYFLIHLRWTKTGLQETSSDVQKIRNKQPGTDPSGCDGKKSGEQLNWTTVTDFKLIPALDLTIVSVKSRIWHNFVPHLYKHVKIK